MQIFKVRVKVSYFYKTLKIFNDFSRENHGHGGLEHGVCRGFLGVSFHLRRCPQGVASVLLNPHFWVPTIKVRPPDGIVVGQQFGYCARIFFVAQRFINDADLNTFLPSSAPNEVTNCPTLPLPYRLLKISHSHSSANFEHFHSCDFFVTRSTTSDDTSYLFFH